MKIKKSLAGLLVLSFMSLFVTPLSEGVSAETEQMTLSEFLKTTDNASGKIMFGRLIESIKVKAVKDDRGNALLENGVNNGSPTAMLFEVPDDLFDLLKKAEFVDDVEIIPVPRNAAYTAQQGETTVDNETIKQHILNKCVTITE